VGLNHPHSTGILHVMFQAEERGPNRREMDTNRFGCLMPTLQRGQGWLKVLRGVLPPGNDEARQPSPRTAPGTRSQRFPAAMLFLLLPFQK